MSRQVIKIAICRVCNSAVNSWIFITAFLLSDFSGSSTNIVEWCIFRVTWLAMNISRLCFLLCNLPCSIAFRPMQRFLFLTHAFYLPLETASCVATSLNRFQSISYRPCAKTTLFISFALPNLSSTSFSRAAGNGGKLCCSWSDTAMAVSSFRDSSIHICINSILSTSSFCICSSSTFLCSTLSPFSLSFLIQSVPRFLSICSMMI